MLTFYVPPGIGDFSPMYSKLCNIERDIVIRPSFDQPHRMGPYLDVLPKIKNGGYSVHSYGLPLAMTVSPGTDLRSLLDGDYFLSINQWLEEGHCVEDWIPGKTSFHYEFAISPEDKAYAGALLEFLDVAPKVGVYTSAYGNSRHWGFWGGREWADFLGRVAQLVPDRTHFIFIGAEYDLAISEIVHGELAEKKHNSHYFVGQTEMGVTVELIRSLDYFFSFPSGLGFIADVVNTPHLMWFPKNLNPMRGTFCDPKNYESGQTLHLEFSDPESAFQSFKQQGLSHLERRYGKA